MAVHTRQAADPQAALDRLRAPLTELAARHGLTVEPGRMVIELRPRGMDKGQALKTLLAERQSGAVMYVGDDLGDLAAFGAVRALRATGIPGLTVCSSSAEVSALAAEADLVVDGPDGVVALLNAHSRRTQLNSSTASTPRWSVPGMRMVRAWCTTQPACEPSTWSSRISGG